jgi:CheY-like chemotaxis protein
MSNESIAFVVEDEVHLRIIFERALKRAGFEVVMAKDGREALEILPTIQPHMILLDLNLPYVNGIEIYRHLRQSPSFSKVWVVLATANAVQASYIETQSDDYLFTLLKPIGVEQLIQLAAKLNPKRTATETQVAVRIAAE